MKTFAESVVLLFIFLAIGCASSQSGARNTNSSPGSSQHSGAAQSVQAVRSDDPLEVGFQTLVSEIVAGLRSQRATQIAVVQFQQLNGSVTELGAFLAEEMITRLYRTGSFRVVEREMLNQVLAEHEFSVSGLVDESTAKELGKLLGVDAIATGTITDLGAEVRVNLRLIGTETGSVFSVAATTLPKDERLRNLMSRTLVRSTPGTPGAVGTATTSSHGSTEPGLNAEYFNLRQNERSIPAGAPVFRRVDATVNAAWNGSPVPRVNPDWFAVRWTGYINIPATGLYSLSFRHDDSFRVWIDGKLVYNGSVWTRNAWASADHSFSQAGWLPFKAELIDIGGGANSAFRWALPGSPDYTDVSAESFRHDAQ